MQRRERFRTSTSTNTRKTNADIVGKTKWWYFDDDMIYVKCVLGGNGVEGGRCTLYYTVQIVFILASY
jgi:hypothetical protein